jgi:cytochrome b6-f complex iron-sulfur subunit
MIRARPQGVFAPFSERFSGALERHVSMTDQSGGTPLAEKPQPVGDTTRRGILRAVFGTVVGWGFAVLGFTVALWSAGTARFLFPNALAEPPNRFKAGFPADYAPGRVETRFKQQHGVWVVHGVYRGKPQIYALRTVCTHLGCITVWQENEQKFKCPCHGSGFYKDGINFEGPAPRPLERYAIRLADDGQLEVDKSKTFQEEIGGWSDPASYVPV